MLEALVTALILFGATLVSSTFGFGAALFSMPLLTLWLGIARATPLFGLVGPTICAMILMGNWRLVEVASAWRLIASTLLGIPVGVWMVQQVPEAIVTRLLGTFLIAFAGYRLANWRLAQIKSPQWAFPFGFIAGMLGGAYNTNGPPVVIYGEMRCWSPTQFRATLQSYFLPSGLGIAASHAWGGLWTEHIFLLYAVALPGIFLAVVLGGQINRRIPAERFQRSLSVLLILLGALLWL